MNHLQNTSVNELTRCWIFSTLRAYLTRKNNSTKYDISFSSIWELNATKRRVNHTPTKSYLLSSLHPIIHWEPTVIFQMLIPIRSCIFSAIPTISSTCVDIFIQIHSKSITGIIRPAGDSFNPDEHKDCVDRDSHKSIAIKSLGWVELLTILDQADVCQ